jgi:hypothetical protein
MASDRGLIGDLLGLYDHVRWRTSDAVFSFDTKHRYALVRNWGAFEARPDAKRVAFIGLNPSTADATRDDPTVRRCIRFAKDWGYTGMVMLNAFAFRATDPKDMKGSLDPVGPGNDTALTHVCGQMSRVVACWGVHGGHLNRDARLSLILPEHAAIECLGVTSGGFPKHPLYLKSSTVPQSFWPFTGKRALPEARR